MRAFLQDAIRLARQRRQWKQGRYNTYSEEERDAIKLAIEFDGKEAFWPLSAILNLAFFYGLAFSIAGLSLRISMLWSAIAGVVLGLFIALTFCSHPIFAKLEDWDDLKGRRFFIGVWIKLAIIIGALGVVAWIVRSLFSP